MKRKMMSILAYYLFKKFIQSDRVTEEEKSGDMCMKYEKWKDVLARVRPGQSQGQEPLRVSPLGDRDLGCLGC